MNTGRDRSGWQVASHELQQCHLRGRVLHGHSIRLELESRIAPDVLSIVGIREEGFLWVVEMGVEDLLGVHERAIESLAYNCQVFRHLLVVDEVVGFVDVLADLPVERRVADGGHGSSGTQAAQRSN